LLGRWKSAAVRAFSTEMRAPIGKVGSTRSRYIRFPPSSTMAIEPPSLPRRARRRRGGDGLRAVQRQRLLGDGLGLRLARQAGSAAASRNDPVAFIGGISSGSGWAVG
jgi:hypothetical protein